MEKKYDDKLCLAPWLSLHTWPDGSTFPCCVWDNTDPIGNINDTPLSEIWNGDKLKDTRLKMLNGERVESCRRCYKLEKLEPYSYRLKINKDFKNSYNLIEHTDELGNVNKMQIKLWDFRLSNFCNLKCRSCGLNLSSSWYSDVIELHPSLKGKLKALITVNDKVSFMDMIEDQYEYVEEIYFAGGEPLMTPEHYTILDKLIEKGNTNIRLRYSTNLTQLTFKGKHIFEYWKHFPNLEVLVSLDGVKEKGEYIRKGLDYSQLKKNIYDLRDSNLTFTKVGFVVTYGVLNYEHLFEIVLEFLNEDLVDKEFPTHGRYNIREIIFSPIFVPDYFDCSFLPPKIKERFYRRLQTFGDELTKIGTQDKVKQDIIDKLKAIHQRSLQNQYSSEIMDKFIDETLKLDKVRKEKFNDVFPEYDLYEDFKTNIENSI